jgi:hypothetical protein
MIISRTPFRISLFGGGSDYPQWYREHGGSVLGFAINKYCYITLRRLPPFFPHRHRIVYSIVETVNDLADIQHPAVRNILQDFDIDFGVEIHHDGDLPARSGLGSSSSFTVGLISALNAQAGQIWPKERLARAAEQDRLSLQNQLEVVKVVEAMRGSLYQKEVGSKLNYLDAQEGRMHAERESADMIAHLNELQHYLESSEASRQVFTDEWHRQQLEELSKARDEFSKISANLAKARRLSDLVVLTAPSNGIVLEIARRSVGSVLNAAEALVTIIPTDAPLIADVMISSGDVGYAKPGDEVMIKVDDLPLYKAWHAERAPAVHWRRFKLTVRSRGQCDIVRPTHWCVPPQSGRIDRFDADGLVAQRTFISGNVING